MEAETQCQGSHVMEPGHRTGITELRLHSREHSQSVTVIKKTGYYKLKQKLQKYQKKHGSRNLMSQALSHGIGITELRQNSQEHFEGFILKIK